MSCIGRCKQYKKPRRYDTEGSRYCTTCDMFLEWDSGKCPCCGKMLKIKPSSSKSKRVFEKKYPDRATKRIR